MGLIKSAASAAGGAVKGIAGSAGGALLGGLSGAVNQAMFLEYLTSGDMSGDIIMKRAISVKPNGNQNTKTDANVISDGSYIDVQHNQCMIIVENGKIVEACMEPGRFIYKTDLAPSFFGGDKKFTESVVNTAKEIWQQAKMGGTRRNTQRVYFINMGILDQPFNWGLGNIPFRHSSIVADNMPPIRVNMTLKGFGVAKVRVTDPVAFFMQKGAQKAGGDNNGVYTLQELQDGLFTAAKSKVRQAIASAISDLGRKEAVAYTEIMAGENALKIEEMVNKSIATTELGECGFSFSQFSISDGFVPTEEDKKKLADLEMKMGEKVFTASDAGLAQYDVMKAAASNTGGAGTGFMGLGMMGFGMNAMTGMGGMAGMTNPPQNGYQQPVPQPQQRPAAPVPASGNTWTCSCGNVCTGAFCTSCGSKKPEPKPAEGSWTCTCGQTVSGNFCPNCGSKKPEEKKPEGWTCSCGSANQGNFCMNCGAKRPAGEPLYRCDKCGWEPEDPKNPPKFCPQCGDRFDEGDVQK